MNQNRQQEARQVKCRTDCRKDQFFEGVHRMLMSSPLLPRIMTLADRYNLLGEGSIGNSGYFVGQRFGAISQKDAESLYFILMASSLGAQIRALGDECGLSGAKIRAEIIQGAHRLVEVALVGKHAD